MQVFWPKGGAPLPILGAVGRLQFEVLAHRLKEEYGCAVLLEPRGFQMARWLQGGWPEPSRYWSELSRTARATPPSSSRTTGRDGRQWKRTQACFSMTIRLPN